jgi:hypothetical protein
MTQLTPTMWSMIIWPILYGLIAIWFLYVFYLLMCRQLCSRDNKASLFPAMFWFLFIIANVVNGVWLYLYMHHDMLVSGIVLLVLNVILYALCLMAYRVCWHDVSYDNNRNTNDVEQEDNVELSHCEVVLLRILTLNAFPLYAVWCSIIACIQWTIIFKYMLFHWSDSVSSIITLAIFTGLMLILWSIAILFKREYFVWTWLPSASLIVVFIGMIHKHHSIGGIHAPGLLFAFILLIVTCVMLLIKLVTLCLCHPKNNNNPRFSKI